jgi:cell division protein FtsB
MDGFQENPDGRKEAKHIGVQFKINTEDAKAAEEHVADIQKLNGDCTKGQAFSEIIRNSKAHVARLVTPHGVISFFDKHFNSLETHSYTLMSAAKAMLLSVDQDMKAERLQFADKIDEISHAKEAACNQYEAKIAALEQEISALSDKNDSLNEQGMILKREHEALLFAKMAFEKSQSSWEFEKSAMAEKIFNLQATIEQHNALKSLNQSLQEEVAKLRHNLIECQHRYEVKAKEQEIEFQKILSRTVTAEVEKAEERFMRIKGN